MNTKASEAGKVKGDAVFSACGKYRYLLTRRLSDREPNAQDKVATFMMLNPSVADATRNDPTIRKCIGFARRWQCDAVQVLNLFAIRATLPREMKRAADPVGRENLDWFTRALTKSKPETNLAICAWGIHGTHHHQNRIIIDWLHAQDILPYALGLTRDGHPRHPLYVPYTTRLVVYELQ